jgi:hypothetical protein
MSINLAEKINILRANARCLAAKLHGASLVALTDSMTIMRSPPRGLVAIRARSAESFTHVFARYPSPENWESDDRIHRGPPLFRKTRSGACEPSERSNRGNSP